MIGQAEPTVRFAGPPDHAFVVRTGHQYIPPDRVRRMIDQQQVVVAERDGVPVAYACFDYLGVVHPLLAAVWVLDEHRRRGVGRAILRFLEDHLRARGHGVLYSSCVVDEKPPQDWHRRVGFEECGFIAGLNRGGVGEVFFRKRLTG
jgi:GNAT superfamily N-acetyltransferase